VVGFDVISSATHTTTGHIKIKGENLGVV